MGWEHHHHHHGCVLHNFRVCFAAMTHFLIWPRNPKRLVYRHVIYFYKPSFFFVGSQKNEDLLCQRVLGSLELSGTRGDYSRKSGQSSSICAIEVKKKIFFFVFWAGRRVLVNTEVTVLRWRVKEELKFNVCWVYRCSQSYWGTNWGSCTVKDLKWELRRKWTLHREVHATRNWWV